ncbi:EMIL3 protein, partial [Amia calva]|nr:EMIL3 protein [Amia calva]
MSRHKNYCAYVVQRNITCTMQDGTSTYVKAEYTKCAWGQKCPVVMYRTFYKPKYKVGYKTVTELEWRCCPGFSGEGCYEGPTSLPDMMPPFKGSMTPPGFKGHPRGHPRGHPDHKSPPTGHLEPMKPFPVGQPIPTGHMPPGHTKAHYVTVFQRVNVADLSFSPAAHKFQGLLGERVDRMEEELRRLSQGFDSLNSMVTGLEDSLRLSMREDTNKMLGSLLNTPPRPSDIGVGFGVLPAGSPDGLAGGEDFPGFGDLAGRVTAVKDELTELQGTVLGHDGKLKHLLDSAKGRPSTVISQTAIEELVDSKLAGIRAEILDGFERRFSGLEIQCEARIGEIQRQCHQDHLTGQQQMQQTLDGTETGLKKELGNLQAQIQGLTLTESCCGQVSSLSNRVLLLEEAVKHLTESLRNIQSILHGDVTSIDGRLEDIEARLNSTEKDSADPQGQGSLVTGLDGFKNILDEKLKVLEDRLVAVEQLSNATSPALLEGQAVPALELQAIRRRMEGELDGMQKQLSNLETLCSSGCTQATGDVQKLHTEMEECRDTEKRVSGQLDVHSDFLNRLNSTLQQILAKLAREEEEGSIQGEITLLKINVNSVNRTLKGLRDSVSLFSREVSHANSTWQQQELKIADQVQSIHQLVGRQASQLSLSERRLHQLKGELQGLKHRLYGEVQGCKNTALGVQREVTLVDGRVTQVEGLCGNLGDLAEDLERIRAELESHSNSYLSQMNGTISNHSSQLVELKEGLKDCLNKTGEAETRGDH